MSSLSVKAPQAGTPPQGNVKNLANTLFANTPLPGLSKTPQGSLRAQVQVAEAYTRNERDLEPLRYAFDPVLAELLGAKSGLKEEPSKKSTPTSVLTSTTEVQTAPKSKAKPAPKESSEKAREVKDLTSTKLQTAPESKGYLVLAVGAVVAAIVASYLLGS